MDIDVATRQSETEGHMGVDVVTNPDDRVDRHGDNLHL